MTTLPKMFGMAAIAVLMGVGFASCSKENPDSGASSNEKKLTKLASSDANYSITFTYDNKGRMITATEVSNYSDQESFLWGDNTIKYEDVTFTLENGLVQREDSERKKFVYNYNQSNKLVKYECEHSDTEVTFMWDGEKLVSVTEVEMPNSDYTTTTETRITYGETCKHGYNPYIIARFGIGSSGYLYLAHPELIGLRSKQLPKSVTSTRTDRYSTIIETTSFSYEFDKDGYVSKMTVANTYEGESSTSTVVLTWE